MDDYGSELLLTFWGTLVNSAGISQQETNGWTRQMPPQYLIYCQDWVRLARRDLRLCFMHLGRAGACRTWSCVYHVSLRSSSSVPDKERKQVSLTWLVLNVLVQPNSEPWVLWALSIQPLQTLDMLSLVQRLKELTLSKALKIWMSFTCSQTCSPYQTCMIPQRSMNHGWAITFANFFKYPSTPFVWVMRQGANKVVQCLIVVASSSTFGCLVSLLIFALTFKKPKDYAKDLSKGWGPQGFEDLWAAQREPRNLGLFLFYSLLAPSLMITQL